MAPRRATLNRLMYTAAGDGGDPQTHAWAKRRNSVRQQHRQHSPLVSPEEPRVKITKPNGTRKKPVHREGRHARIAL